MINYDERLVSELNTILPTYFEMFVDSTTQTPCITYLGVGDSAHKEGDTIRYSNVTYTIKLWGDELSVLKPKVVEVDSKMKELGFWRDSYNTLTYDKHIQLILTYTGLGKE